MRRMRVVVALLAVLAGCTSFRSAMPGPMGELLRPPAAARKIRVALSLAAPSASVRVSGPGMVYDRDKRVRLSRFPVLNDSMIRAGRGSIEMSGRTLGSRRISIIPDMPQSLWVNGILYRGIVDFVADPDGSLTVVNTVPLDDYLMGVVPKETFAAWPDAALRAQAVAARSFAVYHIRHYAKPDYDIIAPTHQLYGGVSAEDPRTSRAVLDTQNEVITYRGDILCTYFHTCCGGRTEDARNVFPSMTMYPAGVVSHYDTDSPHAAWRHSMAAIACAEKLRLAGKGVSGPVTRVTDIERTSGGRVARLRFVTAGGSASVSGIECRQILGNDRLRSTWFDVTVQGGQIEFIGRGWGHGVGLCQWCSRGMANRGFSCEQILGHFYPGAELHR